MGDPDDELLPDVAPLGEAHRLVFYPHLLGKVTLVEVYTEPGDPGLEAKAVHGGHPHRYGASLLKDPPYGVGTLS